MSDERLIPPRPGETREWIVDKSQFGEGPWQGEPDRLEWRYRGLPCLIVRNARMGFLCGYVAVPPGHPLHGKKYDDDLPDLEVHGGITYANRCAEEGPICHVPLEGEPADVWWLGFDTGHFLDFTPSNNRPEIQEIMRKVDADMRRDFPHWDRIKRNDMFVETYRDLAYVRAEVEHLADQLIAITEPR